MLNPDKKQFLRLPHAWRSDDGWDTRSGQGDFLDWCFRACNLGFLRMTCGQCFLFLLDIDTLYVVCTSSPVSFKILVAMYFLTVSTSAYTYDDRLCRSNQLVYEFQGWSFPAADYSISTTTPMTSNGRSLSDPDRPECDPLSAEHILNTVITK